MRTTVWFVRKQTLHVPCDGDDNDASTHICVERSQNNSYLNENAFCFVRGTGNWFYLHLFCTQSSILVHEYYAERCQNLGSDMESFDY
jgi:hypothetical protein